MRVVEERVEQGGPDAAAAKLRENPRRDERAAREVRTVGDSAAGQGAVELGEEQQPLGCARPPQLLGGHRLVRHDRALRRRPGLQVGVGLDATDVDHPDLFSFP